MSHLPHTSQPSIPQRGAAVLSAVALASSLLQLAVPSTAVAAPLAQPATTVVRLSTLSRDPLYLDVAQTKWFQMVETAGASGAFVHGPATPPIGTGSFYFTAGASGGGHLLATVGYTGTKLADITKLTYQSFISPTSALDPMALNLGVDFDGTDADVSWQGRLVFVPSFFGTLTANTWQTWDGLANVAGWYATRAPFNALCSQATPCTWTQVLTHWPNAVIHTNLQHGMVGLKLGNNGHAADVAADALTVGVNGTDTLYDFEPEIACTTVCYADAVNGNDAFGGGTANTAKKTIQAAIDAVQTNGTVRVLPGTYSETASNRTLTSIGGTYQFGLFFADSKPGVTVQGVTAADAPITNYANVLATINTNATNNFGPSGVFVEGDNITIAGVKIGTNSAGQNKTFEVIGDNFTLKNSHVADPGGSVYINDFRFDTGSNTSHVKAYTLDGNYLPDSVSVDLADGAGFTGPVSGRKITNNVFTNDADTFWPSISFNGSGTGVPWYIHSVGGAIITGNSFTNVAPDGQHIRARGTYDNSQFDWASYWNNNTYNKAVVVGPTPPSVLRTYSYTSGSYVFNDVRRIGAAIQPEVDHAVSGDTVLVAHGLYTGVLNSVLITVPLTLKGAGAGTNPALHTIISSTETGASGVLINPGVQNVTVSNLRVQGFDQGGVCAQSNTNGLVVSGVHSYGNLAGGSGCQGGISALGPIDNVTISGNDSSYNGSAALGNIARGIVIWDNYKTHITITNNIVRYNNCCGIELQDGSASGVLIANNTVEFNGDSGIATIGLKAGAGPNVIRDNTLRNNGRFGIEVKVPDGTGLETGDGSIVISGNTVALTDTIANIKPGEVRDLAGIAVFRRGFILVNGNVNIPTGVIVRNNTVSGYQQTSTSDGFGIVMEGLKMTAKNNTLTGNDVGVQAQGGHTPYVANTSTDGDQSNLADQFFGRGNSPVACVDQTGNVFSGNGVNTRMVGTGGFTRVFNMNTGEGFCTIQSAIDDSDTVNGHVISVTAGTYLENVVITKSVVLKGAQVGLSGKSHVGAETVIQATSNSATPMDIRADNVTIDGFKFEPNGFTMPWFVTAISEPGGDGRFANLKINNNIFIGNTPFGTQINPGGAYIVNGDDTLFEGNWFEQLGSHAVFMANTSSNAIYRNNYSFNNYLSNFSMHTGPHTHVLVEGNDMNADTAILFNMKGAIVRNNVLTSTVTSSGRIYLGGGDEDVVVTNNKWDSVRSQAVIAFDAGFGYGPDKNITITQNIINTPPTFFPNATSIIDVRGIAGSTLISGNQVTIQTGGFAAGTNQVYAIGVRGDMKEALISHNTLNGSNQDTDASQPSSGLFLRVISDTAKVKAVFNVISGFNNGVESQAQSALASAGVQVNRNSLAGNGTNGFTNAGSTVLNGLCNWWGAANGPSGIGVGSGTSVSANVSFSPWLASSNLSGLCNQPTLSISDGAAPETNAGTTPLTFTVTLAPAVGVTVTVDYSTQSGSAASGIDFAAASGTLTFAPGETKKVITVSVNGDTAFEPNETFTVVITNATNALIIGDALALAPETADAGPTGIGTIVNDDDAPIVGLVASNSSPTPLTQATTLTATQASGDNVTYAWAFGDGATGSGPFPTHIYPAIGVYTAVVTATNQQGSVTATTVVNIINTAPVANAGPDQTVFVNDFVSLDGSGSSDPNGQALQYGWLQVSGPTVWLYDANTVKPSFWAPWLSCDARSMTNRPEHACTLIFQLTVTDTYGLTSTDTVSVVVDDRPLAGLSASSDSPTVAGSATNFNASVTAGTGVIYEWDFGDGTTGGGQTPSHIYNVPGTYVATVTARNSANSASKQVTVVVLNATPVAHAGPDSGAEVGKSVTLDGSGSFDPNGDLPLSYEWSQTSGTPVVLKDGNTAFPSFEAPDAPSILIFKLVVRDTRGAASDADNVQITVNDGSILGLLAVSDSPVMVNTAMHFTATASAGTSVVYTWNFGDGGTGLGKHPSHTYGAPGNYTVQVTASNSKGSVSTTLGVNVFDPPPVANAGNDGYVLVSGLYTLDGSGSSDPNNNLTGYAWTQTGGTPVVLSSSTAQKPSFTAPSSADTLTFELVVSDAAGNSSVADSVTVSVTHSPLDGLTAYASTPTVLNSATLFTATLASGTGVSFVWEFGDGTVGTGMTTSHKYTALGAYTAIVTATGSSGSASASVVVIVVNVAPIAGATPSQPSASAGARVTLNGNSSYDPNNNGPLVYNWVQLSGPHVELSNPTSATPSFIAPSVEITTSMTFRLVVFDSLGAASVPVLLTLSIEPVGVAGPTTSILYLPAIHKE